MKKLTIVFPVYNDNALLNRAFEGLSNQTFKDFSVVLLDDVSPTSYDEVVSKWRSSLDISMLRNERNLGAMGNIWKSIRLTVDTPYLMSHHSDDFLKANYLQKAIETLDSDENISFVLTGPEWIAAETPYRKETIDVDYVDFFDAADFARNTLSFAPYMFGSVVYRTKEITNDWKFADFDTYCDRYFLGKILQEGKTTGAFIHGKGIMERDHSFDSHDTRSTGLNENHAINLMAFYKEILLLRYPEKEVDEIITNNTIYYFSNFNNRSSFLDFYKKQKVRNLIKFKSISCMGLVSILSLSMSYKNRLRINSFVKKIKKL